MLTLNCLISEQNINKKVKLKFTSIWKCGLFLQIYFKVTLKRLWKKNKVKNLENYYY